MRIATLTVLTVFAAGTAPAAAGGFDRFQQNVDLLFAEDQFVFNTSVAHIAPSFT